MGTTSTLTVKGQTTVPKNIRSYLGLHAGDRLDFVVEEGRVILQPATAGDKLFLSCVVLCELVWVLEDCYSATKRELGEILEKILQVMASRHRGVDPLRWAMPPYALGIHRQRQ